MQNKAKAIIPALLFLAVFFVYTRTLNPAFHADDSPETIACSYTLGIQHPPGYPLPTIIGKIFSMIPAGGAAFRANLQAAVFGALFIVLFYLIMADTLKSKDGDEKKSISAALIAALMLAFSFTVWNQSMSAKGGIYTLNACMLAAVYYSLFLWERTKQYKYFYLGTFIYGLSLGNHWESMGVAFPALLTFIILVFMKDGYYKTITPRRFLTALGLGFTAVFIYAYLVIRAQAGTFLNWGDPVDLKQLLWVVTRAEYTALEQAKDFTIVFKQVSRIAGLVLSEITLPGFLLFIAGIYGMITTGRKQRVISLGVLFITVIISLAFYLNLKDEMMWIMDVFLIPAYFVMAVFAGAGVYALLRIADRGLRIEKETSDSRSADSTIRIPQSAILKVLPLAVCVLATTIPVFLFVANFKKADQSHYYYSYDFGMNIIKSVDEPGAMAMLEGDFAVLPMMYFKYVEKKLHFCPVTTIFLYVPWSVKNLNNECPDVKMTVPVTASLTDKIHDIINSNYKQKPIYTSVFRKTMEEYYPQAGAVLSPYGLLMKFSSDKAGDLKQAMRKLKILSYRNLLVDRLFMDTTTRLGMSNYASVYMETGNALSAAGNYSLALKYLQAATAIATQQTLGLSYVHLGVLKTKMKDYTGAVELYLKAIKSNPELIEAYTNLAGLYNNEKKYDEALALCERAVKVNPSNSEVYNNMALAWYYKGSLSKAVELLEKAVSLNPNNAIAVQNLQILKGMKK